MMDLLRTAGRVAGVLFAAGVIAAAQGTEGRIARPGTVNYIEGQVDVNGAPLSAKQDGQTTLQMNQSLDTQVGKAEILLSPGVFLRVGNHSEIRMVSDELVNPTVELVHGEAMIEADPPLPAR